MTEKQFLLSKFKPFEVIEIDIPDLDGLKHECILEGIDFVERIMYVRPIDVSFYEDEQYAVKIERCERKSKTSKSKKLKIVK